MRLFKILKRTSVSDYKLIFKIYFLLYKSKWRIEKHSLQEIINWISLGENVVERALTETEKIRVYKIAHYTNVISKFVFFKSKCYDKALTTKKILNTYNIPSSISMGIKTSELDNLEAHAILTCNFRCILGGDIAHEYTFVRTFI